MEMETELQNQVIKEAMGELLKESRADTQLEEVDEVVYSYVAGILDESISEVDVEEFISIMDAYVPGFSVLQPDRVKLFMRRLHVSLSNAAVSREEDNSQSAAIPVKDAKPRRRNRRTTSGQSSESDSVHMTLSPPNYSEVITRNSQRTVSETSWGDEWPGLVSDKERSRHESVGRSVSVSSSTSFLSYQTDPDSQPDSSEVHSEPLSPQLNTTQVNSTLSMSYTKSLPYIQQQDKETLDVAVSPSNADAPEDSETSEFIDQLTEMFPDKCATDIKTALQRNHNNLEDAVTSLLDPTADTVIRSNHDLSRDSNTTVKLTSSKQRKHSKSSRKKSNSQSCDEVSEALAAAPEMKSLIVNKYSYIPTDSEEKTHKPKLMVNDEKKMVRYRNGQVVSMKGERFSDAKTTLTDDMKKTYINLKPAKQYRFH